MAELIKVTVQDHIATVMMNRPPVNAQNTAFREELIQAFDSFTDRDDVRVIILTGFGACKPVPWSRVGGGAATAGVGRGRGGLRAGVQALSRLA